MSVFSPRSSFYEQARRTFKGNLYTEAKEFKIIKFVDDQPVLMAAKVFEEHHYDFKQIETIIFAEEKPLPKEDEIVSTLTE